MAMDFGPQLTLPTNPNCVTFAASAYDVLIDRTWSDVQQKAARALQDFYAASRISPTAFFGWRISRARKNRSTPMVTMQFVFDGPASADHLAGLETVVSNDSVHWSPSSIERIPSNSIPSLMVTTDGLFQLWRVEEDGEVAQRLEMSERGIRVTDTQRNSAIDSQFLPGVKHASYRRPTAEEHDEGLERMRLVFAEHFARRIVEADGVVHEDEEQFLETVFPELMLRRMGLVDHALRSEWYAEAVKCLPSKLGHHDKLAMIGLFFSACYSDGSLDAREMRVLKEAGEILGLTKAEVVKYLQRFW